jgi:hypothetical protein
LLAPRSLDDRRRHPGNLATAVLDSPNERLDARGGRSSVQSLSLLEIFFAPSLFPRSLSCADMNNEIRDLEKCVGAHHEIVKLAKEDVRDGNVVMTIRNSISL